uniref:Uncharacterized protein n=1 Tax=Anopheles atroparvus TaxID=41427 RepID=A0AAG5DDI3_ANOAO
MNQEAEHEHKHISVKKNRDKVTRRRNKRRCKRKKPTRAHKRFCNVKESFHDRKIYKGNICGFAPRIHTIPVVAPVRIPLFRSIRNDSRIKFAQNVWIRTYQKIVKWQSYHQMNYWQLCALRFKAQNDCLSSQQPANGYGNHCFINHYLIKNGEIDPYGDTDNEDADDSTMVGGSSFEKDNQPMKKQRQAGQTKDSYNLDEEFLSFLEVSARHRFEHQKLKNELIE